jgi:hypothetical protein
VSLVPNLDDAAGYVGAGMLPGSAGLEAEHGPGEQSVLGAAAAVPVLLSNPTQARPKARLPAATIVL